jgi:hypothetical protein
VRVYRTKTVASLSPTSYNVSATFYCESKLDRVRDPSAARIATSGSPGWEQNHVGGDKPR